MAATPRSSTGAVSAAPYGHRTTPPARMAAPHQNNVFDANIPGRMIVDSSPAAAMSRSISAWTTAIGFGCWKKGCGVWCGEERKTTRGAWAARRSTTAGTVAGGAVQTRKTAPAPLRPTSSDSGTVRSPVTTSTFAGSAVAASARRVRARTGTPSSTSRSTTPRPTRPVAPVTSTGGAPVRVMKTPSVAGARSESCHLRTPGCLLRVSRYEGGTSLLARVRNLSHENSNASSTTRHDAAPNRAGRSGLTRA